MHKRIPMLWLICLLVLVVAPVTTYANENATEITIYVGEINTDKVPVYESASTKSKILGYLKYGDSVSGERLKNDRWMQVTYAGDFAYIYSSHVAVGGLHSRNYTMPKNSGYKSFMFSSSISSWDPARVKKLSKVGRYGILTVNDRFCVAIGTKAGVRVGQYFDVILRNGTIIPCVMCDTKDNKDTLANNMITKDNGCCLEFVVDKASFSRKAMGSGDTSSCNENWKSPVVSLKIYDYNVLR